MAGDLNHSEKIVTQLASHSKSKLPLQVNRVNKEHKYKKASLQTQIHFQGSCRLGCLGYFLDGCAYKEVKAGLMP